MLLQSIERTLNMLSSTIAGISDDAYRSPLDVLSGASVGQHVRHIAEMYVCLYDGMLEGAVCYEKRKRDISIEMNKHVALELLNYIIAKLEQPDKPLQLLANFEMADAAPLSIPTSYQRELAYNLEHSIHHMAIIKIGLESLHAMPVTEAFGVAPSTLRYRQQLA